MRVIHFADLHIGVETYGRPLANQPWSSRMQDFLDAFDELVEFALAEGVDAVIFAGDGRAHALEIFRTLSVPHVYVGDRAWFEQNGHRPQVLETRAGPLQVGFLPWPQVSRWLARSPENLQLSISQQMAEVEKAMTELIADEAAALDPGIPAVLACHVSMNDFLVENNPGSERWMSVGTAPTLLKSNLCAERFDYIALGHHHNNMKLDVSTPCWYSGSMQPVDFGERQQPKGFMVFDIDAAKPRGSRITGSGMPRLHKVRARKFVLVEVAPKDPDPTPEVCRAIEREDVLDAIVRVEIALDREQERELREGEVRRLLDTAHYVAGIRKILPEEQRIRVLADDDNEPASPLEALEEYFRSKQYEEERRKRLITAAEHLIESAAV
jgi:exonuclease SbcD